jgi:hypothetical protein
MTDVYLGKIRLLPWTYQSKEWLPFDGQVLDIRNYTALFSLLADLQAQVRAAGTTLSLTVECASPAVRLYRRLGFAGTGATDNSYTDMIWR